jgi:hypothetical protein
VNIREIRTKESQGPGGNSVSNTASLSLEPKEKKKGRGGGEGEGGRRRSKMMGGREENGKKCGGEAFRAAVTGFRTE